MIRSIKAWAQGNREMCIDTIILGELAALTCSKRALSKESHFELYLTCGIPKSGLIPNLQWQNGNAIDSRHVDEAYAYTSRRTKKSRTLPYFMPHNAGSPIPNTFRFEGPKSPNAIRQDKNRNATQKPTAFDILTIGSRFNQRFPTP